jgi:DNA-binding transcriptional ArsR family regulator
MEGTGKFDYRELESLLNAPIRLAAMSILAGAEGAEFTVLRDLVGTTDGNLSRHLSKLEEAGLIEVEKRFEGKKPVTWQRITATGRDALRDYVGKLEAIIAAMNIHDTNKE